MRADRFLHGRRIVRHAEQGGFPDQGTDLLGPATGPFRCSLQWLIPAVRASLGRFGTGRMEGRDRSRLQHQCGEDRPERDGRKNRDERQH